jgi:hypothetical protein
MEATKAKIGEILAKSPLPTKIKEYFTARLEKEGVTPVLIESIKSMLRVVEAESFGRMGLSVSEDDDPEIKRAVKMYSAAVEDAMKKYMATATDVADKVAKINTKAAKKLESLEKDALKASVA